MTSPTRPDFSALYASLSPGLLLYTRQLVTEKSEAEDVLHEAFVRLFSQAKFPPKPKPWLVLTLRRLALDRRKALFRRRRREAASARQDMFVLADDTGLDAQAAAAALASLPQRQREVVILRTWNDLTLAQIAVLLGVSVATVHADLSAALVALRARLASENPVTHSSERRVPHGR